MEEELGKQEREATKGPITIDEEKNRKFRQNATRRGKERVRASVLAHKAGGEKKCETSPAITI